MKQIKIALFIFSSLLSFRISAKDNNFSVTPQTITVTNPEPIELKDEPISITGKKLKGGIPKGQYPRLVDENGTEIPSQLVDNNHKGKFDELFFLVDLPANGKKILKLTWSAEFKVYPKRANVRFGKRESKFTPVHRAYSDTFYPNQLMKITGYEPYQTDGPMWENDRVAFRHYFDGRNAKDFFGKKVTYISPDTVGLNSKGEVVDNYHVMEDWGRDVLPVGPPKKMSVGIGGFGLLYNDGRLQRIGVTADDSVHNIEKTGLVVNADGPLKGKLTINYHHFKPEANRDYDLKETPTIWPGMYGYQNTAVFNNLKGDETLVVGLPKLETDKNVTEIKQGKWVILYTHDRQTYNKVWILGLAIIVPLDIYEGWGKAPDLGAFAQSYYAKLRLKAKTPISYYAVAGWEYGDKGFEKESYFVDYLKSLAKQLEVTPIVTIN